MLLSPNVVRIYETAANPTKFVASQHTIYLSFAIKFGHCAVGTIFSYVTHFQALQKELKNE